MDPADIGHVSDTARWVALYRATETERADSLFSDPWARQLAGERGQQIAATMPSAELDSWSAVIRTLLFDEILLGQLQAGVDMVINLACGLDARPYRMKLPAWLTWVEVDFPEVLAYKAEVLGGEQPACALERVGLDLADAGARRAMLDGLGQRCSRALVLSEGLLVYLSEQEATGLATDLARPATLHSWLLDLVSPPVLALVQQTYGSRFKTTDLMKFAPAHGPGFFSPLGWQPMVVRSIIKEALRLGRLQEAERAELGASIQDEPRPDGSDLWTGVCLLSRCSG